MGRPKGSKNKPKPPGTVIVPRKPRTKNPPPPSTTAAAAVAADTDTAASQPSTVIVPTNSVVSLIHNVDPNFKGPCSPQPEPEPVSTSAILVKQTRKEKMANALLKTTFFKSLTVDEYLTHAPTLEDMDFGPLPTNTGAPQRAAQVQFPVESPQVS